MFAIQNLINEAVKSDREDYVQTSWHSSALGSCLTGAYLTRKGVCKKEFDERTLRVFQVGNMMEDWVVDLVKKSGVEHETQVRVEWKEMDMTGKIDIMIEGVPFEIKSKQSRAFHYMKTQGAQYHHKMQLWSYLKAKDLPRGELLYVSKDDLCMAQFPVMLDDKELEEAVTKELTILNEAWKQELPPPPIEDKTDWRYKYCSCHEEHCLTQDKYLDISQFENA